MKDGNGCLENITAEIIAPTELTTSISQQTNVGCFGGNTGSVTIQSSGGTGNQTVTMNGNSMSGSTVVFENLAAGVYPIFVTDENNCTVNSSVEITQSENVELLLQNIQNVDCNGSNNGSNNGQIQVQTNGGTGNFTYYLNGVDQGNNNVFTNLTGGTYSILSIDELGCSDDMSVEISEPTAMNAQLVQQANVNCFGENNGFIEVAATGGAGTVQFSLGNETNATGIFNNLSAGNYNITALDGNGCLENITTEITSPTELISSIAQQTNVGCFGGNTGWVTIQTNGGTGNPTVTMNGNTMTGNAVVFENLVAGVYPIIVTDENNCTVNSSVEITQNANVELLLQNTQNINCSGANNGQIEVQATGGTGNFTYYLNGDNQGNNNVFTNLTGGTYTIESIDDFGCADNMTIEISEPTAINAQLVQQANVNCFGENNGSVEVSASGGSGMIQFSLGNETNTTGIFENLSAGIFEIIITDANGCMETVSTQITSPSALTTSISQQTDIDCFGGNTGSVTIQTNGGTGNPTVTMNGNSMTGNSIVFENLVAGVYPIMVTDENNCTVNSSVEITQNANVELLLQNTQNVNCNGTNNGQIEVQANGGTGNFTYYLNGASQGNNNVFTSLSSGTYSIESIDGFGCSDILTVEISEPSALSSQVIQQTNLNCFGENSGSVEVAVSGGTGTIQFTLGNETNTTGVFNNLSAGNYSVHINDENNCPTSIDVAITQPSELTAQLANSTAIDCFGNNSGSIEITASGGAQNYQFDNGLETNSTGVFNNLSAGIYMVTITDGNNCQTTIPSNISQPNELVANISNQQNVNCFGENSGSISLEANGGMGSITFTLNGDSNSTGEFSNLEGGNFSIVVADENNCETTINVNIEEPTALNLTIQNVTEASCAGQEGTVQLTANGGANNYQYTLGNTTNSTGFFENLGGGIYAVEVVDNNGCTDAVQVEIVEPTALSASISQVQNVNCFGENTGSVQLNAVGGIGNLTYYLGNQSNTSGFFQNLNAGNYSVEVEDANNCSSTIEVTIAEPNELEIEVAQIMQIDCYGDNGGMVNLNALGGTGMVEFTLGNQTNTSGVFENLNAGIYTFSSTDGNGCTDELEIEITQPDEISANIQATQNPSCANNSDGILEISAAGGTGNLTYTLDNTTNATGIFQNMAAGNYSVEVTDENNCSVQINASLTEPQAISIQTTSIQNVDCNGESTGMIQATANGGTGNLNFTLDNQTNSTGLFENLNAGIYEITVLDENNCSSISEVEIEEAAAINLNVIDIQDANCFGENTGLISIGASGGTGDFTYTLGNQTNSTGDFSNLEAGSYSIEVLDNNNCFTNLDFTINQPAPLVPTAIITSPIECFGNTGTIQISAEGGIGGYSFSQNNNTITSGIFENLSAGLHEFVIQDANGCEEVIEMNLTQPSEISLEILNTTSVPCAGSAIGTASVQASNGTGSFIYEMNNETNPSGVFENLGAGIYDLTATDANGCVANLTVLIDEMNDIEVESFWSKDVNCFGGNDGTINITAVSSSGDLAFEMNGIQNNTGIFENVESGNYVVSLTDVNGCSELLSFEINEPDSIELEIVALTDVDCFGNSNGVAHLNAIGGTGDFTFALNGEMNNTGIFENLPAGNLTATITDGNGCTQTQAVQITQPAGIETEIVSLTPVDCFGASTGAIQMNATGGNGNFTYTLNGNTNSIGIFENLPAGSFSVQIEDANGCLVNQSFQLNQPTELEIAITDISNDLGNAEGSVSFSGDGGTMPFMFSLDGSNFQSSNLFGNLVAGNYTGFIQDGNGCISQTTFTIEMETSIFSPNSGVTDLNILPNPFSENLFLKIDLEIAQDFQLRMWTVSGKAIFQKTIHLQKGKQQVNLDIENALAAGTYILQVENKIGEVAYFKLVKQR